MENITVSLETDDAEFASEITPVVSIPIPTLRINEPLSAYAAFKKVHGKDSFPLGAFSASLKFISKDCDPQTGEPDEEGYDDVYQVRLMYRIA